jgi:hypothetical protein
MASTNVYEDETFVRYKEQVDKESLLDFSIYMSLFHLMSLLNGLLKILTFCTQSKAQYHRSNAQGKIEAFVDLNSKLFW